MLRRNLKSGAAWPAKDDRDFELSARHVKHFRGGIDDLISGENRKVERHELDDGLQAGHGGANAKTRKPEFSNRRVDDPLIPELFKQAFRDFVCSVVSCNLFAHEEDVVVAQ